MSKKLSERQLIQFGLQNLGKPSGKLIEEPETDPVEALAQAYREMDNSSKHAFLKLIQQAVGAAPISEFLKPPSWLPDNLENMTEDDLIALGNQLLKTKPQLSTLKIDGSMTITQTPSAEPASTPGKVLSMYNRLDSADQTTVLTVISGE